MKIQLITPAEYETLFSIYSESPALSLQNLGYEYINKTNLTDLDKGKIKEVEAILSKSISGFSSFTNFRLSKSNEPQIRFQYNYGYDGGAQFTGVGYILLYELLKGFTD